MCNGAYVPYNCRLNNSNEWEFVVNELVMKTLRNSVILGGVSSQPHDVPSMHAMVCINARAKATFTRLVTRTGSEG